MISCFFFSANSSLQSILFSYLFRKNSPKLSFCIDPSLLVPINYYSINILEIKIFCLWINQIAINNKYNNKFISLRKNMKNNSTRQKFSDNSLKSAGRITNPIRLTSGEKDSAKSPSWKRANGSPGSRMNKSEGRLLRIKKNSYNFTREP